MPPRGKQLPMETQEDYEVWLQTITQLTERTVPLMTLGEDLGDYVETINTLLSFAPRARDDIRIRVKRVVDGG